jgi:mRNA interferase RelE/StbE
MPPYAIAWLEEAKADVRALDRSMAMRVFDAILHFTRTGTGDVTALQGKMRGLFRLRAGDYRVLFTIDRNTIQIYGVRHRSRAYH